MEAISILTPDNVEAVHERAMTILEEIGTDVRHDGALELLRSLGQDVEGERVRWDREFVMEMVARAPAAFTLEPRNPERAVTIGGGRPVLAPVGGSPFCSDLERGRREGAIADHVELVKIAHTADLLTCQQSGTVEAGDLSEHSRHLDMDYSIIRWSDKPYVCYGTSGPKARDAVELAAIACGGRERIERTPAIMGVVNPNSPLVWDFLMVDALTEWARANQPVIVTPFLLAGATAPVSVAGGLALQVAEALTGHRPRAGDPAGRAVPVRLVLHRRRHAHRRARVRHARVGRRHARRRPARPPLRAAVSRRRRAVLVERARRPGGGRDDEHAVGDDARAGATSSCTRPAGWRAASPPATRSSRSTSSSCACSTSSPGRSRSATRSSRWMRSASEGPGGMFLAADHTLAHFRDWVFMSPLFRSQSYVTWEKQGSVTSDRAATAEWKRLLAEWEDPGIDAALDEELREHIARRKAELDAD